MKSMGAASGNTCRLRRAYRARRLIAIVPLLLALAGCGDGDKADPVSLVGHRSAIADAMVGLADDGLVEVKDGTGDLAGATTALTAAIRQASADGVDAAYLNQQIDEAESMGDLASRCSSCLDLLEGARP